MAVFHRFDFGSIHVISVGLCRKAGRDYPRMICLSRQPRDDGEEIEMKLYSGLDCEQLESQTLTRFVECDETFALTRRPFVPERVPD